MDVWVAWEIAIELGEGGAQPVTQGVQEGGDLHGLRQQPIIGDPLRLMMPIGGQILVGIAKGVGAFDPDFFALQGPLEL